MTHYDPFHLIETIANNCTADDAEEVAHAFITAGLAIMTAGGACPVCVLNDRIDMIEENETGQVH